jgi:hypothetical protein
VTIQPEDPKPKVIKMIQKLPDFLQLEFEIHELGFKLLSDFKNSEFKIIGKIEDYK